MEIVQAETVWGGHDPMSAVLPCSSGNCVRKVGVCFKTHICLGAWEHICRHSCLQVYLCALLVYMLLSINTMCAITLQSALACFHVLDGRHLEWYYRAMDTKCLF